MENEAKLIVKLLNLNFQSTKPRTKKLKGKKKKAKGAQIQHHRVESREVI